MIYDPAVDTTKPGEIDTWREKITAYYEDPSTMGANQVYMFMNHMVDAVLAERERARMAEVTIEAVRGLLPTDNPMDIKATLDVMVDQKLETFLHEPPDRCPVVDIEGFYWHYNNDPDDDEFGQAWVRHRMERQGTLTFGPPLSQDWDDVLQYGPIRRAFPGDSSDYITVERVRNRPEPEPETAATAVTAPGLPMPDPDE